MVVLGDQAPLSQPRQLRCPVATENRIRAGADAAMGYPRFGMLRLGVPAVRAELPPPTRAQTKQSGGELASGGRTTRAQNAAVQVGALRTALSQHARCHPQQLQPPTPSRLTRHAAGLPSRGSQPMARRGHGSVTACYASYLLACRR